MRNSVDKYWKSAKELYNKEKFKEALISYDKAIKL